MEGVNVLEKALGVLKRQLSAEEFLTYLQTITPRVGDATKELSEKTAGLSLQEVIQKAKELEEQSG
ncbi:MAG: hypothetical protein DDT25_00952 [Chloroflexi bacterium]|nr:hypothetical protein [Chloroflexota bacterium]